MRFPPYWAGWVGNGRLSRKQSQRLRPGAPSWHRFLTPWRSPGGSARLGAGQALLAIAAVAAVAYGWGMG